MSKKFTYEEVAAILGVSRQTLYNWQRTERIPQGELDPQIVEGLIDEMEAKAAAEVRRARERFRSLSTGVVAAVPA